MKRWKKFHKKKPIQLRVGDKVRFNRGPLIGRIGRVGKVEKSRVWVETHYWQPFPQREYQTHTWLTRCRPVVLSKIESWPRDSGIK